MTTYSNIRRIINIPIRLPVRSEPVSEPTKPKPIEGTEAEK
jgi:hypothetical protein